MLVEDFVKDQREVESSFFDREVKWN